MRGPMIEDSPKTAPNAPNSLGRFSNLTACPRICRIAMKMPAAPTPERARPKIKMYTSGAIPQMREPTAAVKVSTCHRT